MQSAHVGKNQQNRSIPAPVSHALEDDVLRSLRRIVRAIDLHSRQLTSQYGLTTPQLVCLRALAAGETSPSHLAREVDLSQATVTGIIDRLVKRKLVNRERDGQDRRRVVLTLTGDGEKLVSDAPSPLQDALSRRLSQLSADQQKNIKDTLEQIVEMMGAGEVDASAILASGASVTESDD